MENDTVNNTYDVRFFDDLNAEDPVTMELLDAIERDDGEDIARLVTAGAKVNATHPLTPRQEEYLIRTVWNKDRDDFKKVPTWVLASEGGRSAVNMVSSSGASALFCAVAARWAGGCAGLLRAGADPGTLCDHPERPFTHYLSVEPFKVTPLHLAIELNNIDIADRILTFADRGHVDCLNSQGDTPLHTAIKFGFLACVKLLLRHGASLRNIWGKRNVLHSAVINGHNFNTSILKYLLENDDVRSLINELDNSKGPIHYAVHMGPEFVKILLDKGANVRLRMETQDDYFRWTTPLHYAGLMDNVDCARVILDYDPTTIDDMDAVGRTPLIVALLNKSTHVAAAIVNAGGLSSSYPTSTGKQSAVEMITAKLPNPTGFFEQILDASVYGMVFVGFSSDTIVDYKLLTNENERNPLMTVKELVRCGQRRVLVHPLIESLLYLKWSNLLPLYFVLLGTFAVFVVTLNVFVGMVFYYRDREEVMSVSVITILAVDGTLLYISIFLLILQEWLQMRVGGIRYWHSVEAALTLLSVALGAALPMWLGAAGRGAAARHAASAALLLAWLRMIVLLARFPRWGYYMLMMAKVTSNIAKILLTAIFLVLGFALSFMIQFHSTPPFDGPLAAFTKTLVMMASEFEYENLFREHDVVLAETKTMVRLLFILFLIFVSIVLMNFMVGVAVNDIHNLTVSGNVRRLQKQLELLCTLETLAYDGHLENILPRTMVNKINKRRFISKITVNPGTTKIWTVHCEDEEDSYEIQLPRQLYQAAVSIEVKFTRAEFYSKKVNNMVCMLYEANIKSNESIDPDNYTIYNSVKVKSKLDDVLQELKVVKEELTKLQNSRYDQERPPQSHC